MLNNRTGNVTSKRVAIFQGADPATDVIQKLPQKRNLKFHLYTLWLFTYSDLKTIVSTQTAVGIFSALAGSSLTTNQTPHFIPILSRTPHVLLWNWLNLLCFNIANQRLPKSIIEDSINKPFRPLPSKRLTPEEARRTLFLAVPCCLLAIYFIGAFDEACWMVVLTWMYNDLGGADEGYMFRNLLQAGGFICHARGSTLVTAGITHGLGPYASVWFAMIGAIVFTSIQTQDLEDMKGDAVRGRKTLPLVLGEEVGRLSVAVPVLFWSFACPTFWGLTIFNYLPTVVVGVAIAYRVLVFRNVNSDKITWKLWCLWIILIYLLPLLE